MSITVGPDQPGGPAYFKLRLSALFGALFIPNAIILSFFPVWLEQRGLDPVEISTLLTLPVFVRLLTTPLFTHLADKSGERANILIIMAAVSLLFAALLTVASGYWMLAVTIALLSAFWSPQVPIADSIALSAVRRHGLDYSSVRIWGSILFLASSIVAGQVVQRTGAENTITLIVAGFAAIFAASFITPRFGRRRRLQPRLGADANVLLSPRVLLILAATGLIQASHAFMYNFGSIYWQSMGINAQEVGLLWALPVLAEIVLFRFYTKLFGNWKPGNILVFTGLIAIARWVLYSLAANMGFGFVELALVQSLHGLTFGATYLAQQTFLAHAVPEEQAGAAQGLGVFIQGILMMLAMFVSGPLYAAFGGTGYLAMTLVSAAGIGIALWFSSSQAKWLENQNTSAP